ncbi:hypothetical protein JHK82_040108 [Glycine max]|uniref:Uncharacterized protein n=2 Tax=Glycine subgen. Soja TaxID=1462606 RepID=A0A0R0GP08_SOYBN|nr:hypothetical protein JHK87_040118 [Glycine soja]KAG4963435.1 hypothetical protein JHK86_040303 [Glycine max]KAG4965912.1 hypothetical protein JHK85_040887 [Glycine max]KAG5110885.1 hypothetical protein JHK82_040108 [Glycine max]KAG5122181.1 hypothetical protein JHK84_040521 [Glycine max]
MALIHEEFARQGYICLYSKGVKKKKNNKIIWDYVFISSLIQNYINSFIFIHQTGLNFYSISICTALCILKCWVSI